MTWTYLTKSYAEALSLERIPLFLGHSLALKWAAMEYEPIMRYSSGTLPRAGLPGGCITEGVEFEGRYYARERTGGYRLVDAIKAAQ